MMLRTILLLLMAAVAAQAAVIEGRVVDDRGAPVPSAAVDVRCWRGEWRTLQTDAEGRFAIPVMDEATVVVASAPGWAPSGAALGERTMSVTLRLGRPRAVTGEVLAPDGGPAEGVTLKLMAVEPQQGRDRRNQWVYLPERLTDPLTTRTDGLGRYRIDGAPAGKVFLWLNDPRYLPNSIEVGAGPGNAQMMPGCRIRGRIPGAGPDAAGARVSTYSLDTAGEQGRSAMEADGSFLLPSLPPGEYWVQAELPPAAGKCTVGARVHVTAEKPEAEVELALRPGGFVSGKVVDAATRAPRAGVRVGIIEPGLPPGPNIIREVTTAEDGGFRLCALPGRCTLTVWDDAALERRTTPVDVREGQEATVDLTIHTGPSVSGHVVDADGRPAADVVVRARVWAGSRGHLAVTGGDGSFRIGGLPEQCEVALEAWRGEEGLTVPVVAKPPFPKGIRLQIGVLPQLVWTGRVVDTEGRPAPGVGVLLASWRERKDVARNAPEDKPGAVTYVMRSAAQQEQESVTDADGRYRFVVHDLTATCTACIASGPCRALRGGEPVGDTGAERRLSDLVVTPFHAMLEGRVLDARGKPAARATVLWPLGASHRQTTTDSQGRFRLDGLPDEPVCLVAHGVSAGTAFVRAAPGNKAVIILDE